MKTSFPCDLHVHTNYSYDSQTSMETYVLRALKMGVGTLCFTDHIEFSNKFCQRYPTAQFFAIFKTEKSFRCGRRGNFFKTRAKSPFFVALQVSTAYVPQNM